MSLNKKISFDELKDIILKHTDSKDLINILKRLKSTSKSLYNDDFGNDITSRLNYYNSFIFNNDNIIANNTLFNNKSNISKITYKTIPLNEIINKIHNANFRFILNENGMIGIYYDKGKFIFDGIFTGDDRYYDSIEMNGYIKCRCFISFDDTSQHNLHYKITTNPPMRSRETFENYIMNAPNDSYIHEQNTKYSKTIKYINDDIKLQISSFRYINKNKSYIILKL